MNMIRPANRNLLINRPHSIMIMNPIPDMVLTTVLFISGFSISYGLTVFSFSRFSRFYLILSLIRLCLRTENLLYIFCENHFLLK